MAAVLADLDFLILRKIMVLLPMQEMAALVVALVLVRLVQHQVAAAVLLGVLVAMAAMVQMEV